MEEVLKLISELGGAEARRFTIFRYSILISILGIIGSSLLIYQYTGSLELSLLSGLWVSAVLVLVCLSIYLSHQRISLSIERVQQLANIEYMIQSQGDVFVNLASRLLVNETLSEVDAKLILSIMPDTKSKVILDKLLRDKGVVDNSIKPSQNKNAEEDEVILS